MCKVKKRIINGIITVLKQLCSNILLRLYIYFYIFFVQTSDLLLPRKRRFKLF